MSLRLIIRHDDAGMAAHVGGAVLTTFRTFEIEHPEIEALLQGAGAYSQIQVLGVELVALPQSSDQDKSQ